MMRSVRALCCLLAIQIACAAPVAAQVNPDHQEHYDDVLACAAKAHFLANVSREGRGGALPNNRDPGTAILRRLLPVLAWEGNAMGMTVEEIVADFNASNAEYMRANLARINAMPLVQQNDAFNAIVDQLNTCGDVPVIELTSE